MSYYRILALGDNHGNVGSLKQVLKQTEGDQFDFIIHTGDITNTYKTDFETGVERLKAIEPVFEQLSERGELVYIYGNRDHEQGMREERRHVTEEFELSAGRCVWPGEPITVNGQRFTTDREDAAPDDILITHDNYQLSFYDDTPRAYFSGHTHTARQLGRALNTGYLHNDQGFDGVYFVVELAESEMSVDVRGLAHPWKRTLCPDHAWVGTQFLPKHFGCRVCEFGPERQFREMAREAFNAVIQSDPTENVATVDEVATKARELFMDVDDYETQIRAYLEALVDTDSPHPLAPLHPAQNGKLAFPSNTSLI